MRLALARRSAGASSFRRRGRLEEKIAAVKGLLAELAKEVDADPTANEERLRRRRAQRAEHPRRNRLTAQD